MKPHTHSSDPFTDICCTLLTEYKAAGLEKYTVCKCSVLARNCRQHQQPQTHNASLNTVLWRLEVRTSVSRGCSTLATVSWGNSTTIRRWRTPPCPPLTVEVRGTRVLTEAVHEKSLESNFTNKASTQRRKAKFCDTINSWRIHYFCPKHILSDPWQTESQLLFFF